MERDAWALFLLDAAWSALHILRWILWKMFEVVGEKCRT